MIFDKLSCFSNNQAVPATASTETKCTQPVDLRKCNLIDGMLKVYAQIVGDVPETGAITTKLQTCATNSATDSDWTDLVAFTQDGNTLAAAFLPITGKKRFIRLVYAVGTTALSAAVTVKAGLVDQFDVTDLPATQTFPPLEDLAATGL